MSVAYDYLTRILHPATPPDQRLPAIRGFAEELGWTPSYELPYRIASDAIDHLVVEHGLENAAVLSFLQPPRQPADLSDDSLRSLLTLSYNNLVEWHLFVSETQVRYVSNRRSPHVDVIKPLARTSTEYLTDQYFTKNISAIPRRPNISSCDDQLINVVSRWKRLIKADYRDDIDNSHISTLLNSIMFVRACEDYVSLSTGPTNDNLLTRLVEPRLTEGVDVSGLLQLALDELGFKFDVNTLFPTERLASFSTLDRMTAHELFKDFYRPSAAPFDFNFAFMSKHTLSRIYERFVSLLKFNESTESQLSFLPSVPAEKPQEKTGVVYTPQFIAGFFSRYIRENTPCVSHASLHRPGLWIWDICPNRP